MGSCQFQALQKDAHTTLFKASPHASRSVGFKFTLFSQKLFHITKIKRELRKMKKKIVLKKHFWKLSAVWLRNIQTQRSCSGSSTKKWNEKKRNECLCVVHPSYIKNETFNNFFIFLAISSLMFWFYDTFHNAITIFWSSTTAKSAGITNV